MIDCQKPLLDQAQYAVDRQVKEIAIQNDPENISAIEKEYSENLEPLDDRQRRGQDLIKIAKSLPIMNEEKET